MVLNLDILIEELMTIPSNRWGKEEPHHIQDDGNPNNSSHTVYYTLEYKEYLFQLESTIGGVSSGSVNLNVFNKPNGHKEQLVSRTVTNKDICTRARIEISSLAELYDKINQFYSN